jgi:serpin B
MKKTIILSFFLAITAGPMLFSCGGDDAETLLTPDVPDTPDPPKPEPEPELDNSFRLTMSQLYRVNKLNLFSYHVLQELYQNREGEDQSLLISPLSLVCALGMMGEGADESTLGQIITALGFPKSDATGIRNLCVKLLQQLSSIDPEMKFDVANGVFCHQEHRLNPDWVGTLRENYGATAATLDFSDPSSVGSINAWCSEKTQGKISSMADALDPSAYLYVLNALSLDATWTYSFYSGYTSTHTFYRESETQTQMQMMEHHGGTLPHGESQLFQMCELPYGDGKFSMLLIVPSDLYLRDMLQMVGLDRIQSLEARLSSRKLVYLRLPRFQTQCTLDLTRALKSFNITQPFSTSTSGLDGIASGAYVSAVKQSTRFGVDESGRSTMSPEWIQEVDLEILADHPFLYIIKEKTTGLYLFLGTYNGD